MSNVACLCTAPIVAEVRSRGYDVQSLVEGLGLRVVDFENLGGRVPWRPFVEFAARATKILGPDSIEELAAKATVSSVPGPIRRLLPRLSDSRPLFTIAPRWWGPWVFNGTQGTCETLPDGRLREVVRILPPYDACPEFLTGLRGTLRAMPRLLGQSDALVTLEQDGREAEYLITPPPRSKRRGLRSRGSSAGSGVSRWLPRGLDWGARRQLRLPERDLEALGFVVEQVLESRVMVQTMAAELDLHAHRLELLQDLGRALVRHDKDDYTSLQHELVELLIRQPDVLGVRISRRGPESDPTRISQAGDLDGPPDRQVPLRVGEREVGRLALWGTSAEGSLVPLEGLEPWIAFALEFAGSKALVAHLVKLLSDDARDWESMEQRLEELLSRQGGARPPRH